jgi:hypothetical protein
MVAELREAPVVVRALPPKSGNVVLDVAGQRSRSVLTVLLRAPVGRGDGGTVTMLDPNPDTRDEV